MERKPCQTQQTKDDGEWELVFESSDLRTYRRRFRQSTVDDRISPPCEAGTKDRLREKHSLILGRTIKTLADINRANAAKWERKDEEQK